MRALATVLFAAALAGCGFNPFLPGQELAVPATLSETGQEAAKLINGSKVALIVMNNTITQQASDGLILKSEFTEASKWIDARWKEVKDFEKLLGDGKDVLAKGQAELLEKTLAEFQRQLLARAAARAAARKRSAT